jgi:MipA family protein
MQFIVKQISILLAIISMTTLQAEEKPLWEVGVGMAGLNFPNYRGSKHQQNYLLPFPYFIYRGQWLKVTRDGLRGLFYQSPRMSLDISLGGGMPSKSDENTVREGMPDLDPIFEIGPSLKILLAQNLAHTRKLTLKLPIRTAVATNFAHFDHLGWLFAPQVALENFIGEKKRWRVKLAAETRYASQDYHNYYYGVAPKYTTPTRTAYSAKQGYSGTRLTVSLSWRLKNLRLATFLRYDNLEHTVFDDSPLLEKEHSLMAGFAIAWIFARSKHRVTVANH